MWRDTYDLDIVGICEAQNSHISFPKGEGNLYMEILLLQSAGTGERTIVIDKWFCQNMQLEPIVDQDIQWSNDSVNFGQLCWVSSFIKDILVRDKKQQLSNIFHYVQWWCFHLYIIKNIFSVWSGKARFLFQGVEKWIWWTKEWVKW